MILTKFDANYARMAYSLFLLSFCLVFKKFHMLLLTCYVSMLVKKAVGLKR